MSAAATLADRVRPLKTAILVVDMQNDYCHPDGITAKNGIDMASGRAIVPALERLLAAAREHGASVIFIQTIHEPHTDSEAWIGRRLTPGSKNCLKDSWGADFFGVRPEADEPIVIKHRYSAFVNTRLDSVLRTLKIETIVMAGVATNVCVESTARHGAMLDYDTVFVSDGTASYRQDLHDMTLATHAKHFGPVATADELIAAWQAAHAAASV